MIPNFKTYLKESVWMDIHKRSTGKIERKEDDNLYTFCKQLQNIYEVDPRVLPSCNIKYWNKDTKKYGLFIQVPIGANQSLKDRDNELAFSIPTMIHLCYLDDDMHISHIQLVEMVAFKNCMKDYEKFKNEIVNEYELIENYDAWAYGQIKNKNGDYLSKEQCIEIIDKMIENAINPVIKKKSSLSESVWMDIHKQSNGDVERMEDDVNHMDYEELGNYILKNYNLADEDGFSWRYTRGDYIGVNVFFIRLDDNDNVLEYFTAIDNDDDSKRVTVYPNIKELDPNLYNKLKETYKLYDTEDRWGMMSLLGIDPKDGRNIDNKFFIEVLNFIIDNLDSKYRKIIDR